MHYQATISIDDESCRACRKCVARKVCNVKAIVQMDPGEVPWIDTSRCFDCRLCIPACPFGAITAQRATVPI